MSPTKRQRPRHSYHVEVFYYPPPEYKTTGLGYWATAEGPRYQVSVIGYHLPNGRFKVEMASCPEMPEGQTRTQRSGLLSVLRMKLAAEVKMPVILQAEDTDWGAPPTQGRPRTNRPVQGPRFMFYGCPQCRGTLVLEEDIAFLSEAYWACIACGRTQKYKGVKDAQQAK